MVLRLPQTESRRVYILGKDSYPPTPPIGAFLLKMTTFTDRTYNVAVGTPLPPPLLPWPFFLHVQIRFFCRTMLTGFSCFLFRFVKPLRVQHQALHYYYCTYFHRPPLSHATKRARIGFFTTTPGSSSVAASSTPKKGDGRFGPPRDGRFYYV